MELCKQFFFILLGLELDNHHFNHHIYILRKQCCHQNFSLLLQIIFLHTYIFSEYLPINFKFVIGGLYRMQNLNYFHNELADKI